MSCSLPVVTTPAGGIPELVRPGKDGAVTKGFNQDEFAQIVIELLESDSKRQSLGKAGRKRVEESFSSKKIVEKYEKIFEGVLS
jgi:spore coat protein SA